MTIRLERHPEGGWWYGLGDPPYIATGVALTRWGAQWAARREAARHRHRQRVLAQRDTWVPPDCAPKRPMP